MLTIQDIELFEEIENDECITISGGLTGYEYGPGYTGPTYPCGIYIGASLVLGKLVNSTCYVGWYGQERSSSNYITNN